MEIRKIKAEEREAIYQLMVYAFNDWTSETAKPEDMTWANPEDTFGAFDNGRAVGCLKSIASRQNLRGVVKDMRGISAVACSPDYRNRGVATSLMMAALGEMRDAGTPLSMLLPFKESFYARFGYAAANHNMTVTFPLASIRDEHKEWAGPGWRFETVPAPQCFERYRRYSTDKVLGRYHGMAAPANVNEEDWRHWTKKRLVTFASRGKDDEGLLFYGKTSFLEKGKLEISELFTDNAAAHAALFTFIAGHRGQISSVQLRVPLGTPFHRWLSDVNEPLETKIMFLPWMSRITDVAGAAAALPAAVDGSLSLEVIDDRCPWLEGAYTLAASNGALTVTAGGKPQSKLDVRGLSSLVYGALNADDVEQRRWLLGADDNVKKLLNCWFPTTFIFNTFDF